MLPIVLSIIAFSVLPACVGDDSDTGAAEAVSYEVELKPLVPDNQTDLFEDVDSVMLVVEPEVGSSFEYELNNVTTDEYDQVQQLPALDDVTLALVGRVWNAATEVYEVTAFGRSERFSISEGSVEVPILVGKVDKLGWLDAMPGALSGGAIVSDQPGRFLVIGGSTKAAGSTTGASNKILSFRVAPPSDGLSFEQVAELPEDEDAGDGRVGHVAVYLEGTHPDAGKVFIAGGSAGIDDCTTATKSALLWDPATGEFEELDREGRLDGSRTMLRWAVDYAGNIVMAGGAGACSSGTPEPSAMVHIYQPSQRNSSADSIDHLGNLPSWMPALASLGDKGVIICGGVDFETDAVYSDYAFSEQCHRMDAGSELHSNEFQLPSPMGWHDMVTLDDGSVLFTGGFQTTTTSIASTSTQPASNRAWVYDGSSWREVGHMHNARAMHKSVLLPDGRVLVVGGVSTADNMRSFDTNGDDDVDGDGAIACAEIFDPENGTFKQVDDCDGTNESSSLQTRTAHMMVGADDLYGVLIAGGLNDDESPIANAALFMSATVSE